MRGVPNPSLLAVLDFDGDGGPEVPSDRQVSGAGVLQMPMGMVMSMLDRMLGGSGGPDQPIRALRDIEVGLVRQLLVRIVHELTTAFESLAPVSPVIENLESDPQFLQFAAPSEPVIVADFVVRIGERVEGSTLCIPFATLKPALDALSSSRTTHRTDKNERAAAAVERHLNVGPRRGLGRVQRRHRLGGPGALARHRRRPPAAPSRGSSRSPSAPTASGSPARCPAATAPISPARSSVL